MKAFPFSKVNDAYSSVGIGCPYLCGARLARLSPARHVTGRIKAPGISSEHVTEPGEVLNRQALQE
jgi:hypothetical protein